MGEKDGRNMREREWVGQVKERKRANGRGRKDGGRNREETR